MASMLDMRVPVIFAGPEAAGPDDAVLAEAGSAPNATASFAPDMPGPGHAADCACCRPRGEAGRALARLIQARARGGVPFFRRVVAVVRTQAGREAVEAALASDPVASLCYRLEP